MQFDEVGILVVDDVNAMRIQIRDMLRESGFRNIYLAASVPEAMQILAEGDKVQLILCDWHMEPTKGVDLLKYVRSSEVLRGIAFVMVTVENAKENVIKAIQTGVDDYLLKPLTVELIQEKVYKVLSDKRMLI